MYLTEYWHDDDDDEDEILVLPSDEEQSELQIEDELNPKQNKLPAKS